MSHKVILPDDLYQRAEQQAKMGNVSVDEFVSTALAEQLESREFFRSRASRASRESFQAALAQIPDAPPDEHDRL